MSGVWCEMTITKLKSVPKPKRSNTKSWKEKCIRLACRIATLSGVCVSCGRHEAAVTIDPMHIVGQAQSARTAARTDNILPGCRTCHSYFTANPNSWNNFVDLMYPGRRKMLEAVARSQPGVKLDWQKIWDGLVGEAKVIGLK